MNWNRAASGKAPTFMNVTLSFNTFYSVSLTESSIDSPSYVCGNNMQGDPYDCGIYFVDNK